MNRATARQPAAIRRKPPALRLSGLLVLLLSVPCAAEIGRPPVLVFDSVRATGPFATWAVAEGLDGLMYFGTSAGLLEYDGSTWRTITERDVTVRSIEVGDDGAMFVGRVDDLGYVIPGTTGRLEYHSLLDTIDEEDRFFGDVWIVKQVDDAVYYQTFSHLFRWRLASSSEGGPRVPQGRPEVWRAATAFGALCKAGDRLFVQIEGQGLTELKDDRFVLVPGGESFADGRIIADLDFVSMTLPYGDDAILVVHSKRGLFKLTGSSLTPFRTDADELLARASNNLGTLLPDGTLALATYHEGLVLIDRAGRVRRLGRGSGLPLESIHTVSRDREGGLWLALRRGLARVEIPSPQSSFQGDEGLEGQVIGLTRYRGEVLALTTTQLYRLVGDRFEVVPNVGQPGPGGGVGGFAQVGETLLIASDFGLYELDNGVSRRIMPGRTIEAPIGLSGTPARALYAVDDGIVILEREGTTWRAGGRLTGIQGAHLELTEMSPGVVWMIEANTGMVVRVDTTGPVPAIERFDTTRGFPEGVTALDVVDGTLYVTADDRSFSWDDASRRLTPLEETAPDLGAVFLQGVDSRSGLCWLARRDDPDVEIIARHDEDGWTVLSEVHPIGLPQTYAALLETDGTYWFGGPFGVLRWDSRLETPATAAPLTLIRSVLVGGAEVFGGHGRHAESTVIDPGRNRIAFDFALPDHREPGAVAYQTMLDGLDEKWSGWSSRDSAEYLDLQEGSYRFRVRGRTSLGTVAEEAGYDFEVRPPWYRQWPAKAGVAIIVLFIGPAVHLFRTSRLRRRQVALEAIVAERTRRLEEQAVELEWISRQDALTGVANRRAMRERLDVETARVRRHGGSFVVALFDVDHFKRINDRLGHDCGDIVLRKVSEALASCLSETDLLARWGGEEFLALLPDQDVRQALETVDRMCTFVRGLVIECGDEVVRVTVSCGVAGAGEDGPEGCISRADAALYRAKSSGRDRIIGDGAEP